MIRQKNCPVSLKFTLRGCVLCTREFESFGSPHLLSSLSSSSDNVAEWLRRISLATLLPTLFLHPSRLSLANRVFFCPKTAENRPLIDFGRILPPLVGFGAVRGASASSEATPFVLVENGGSNALCLGLLPSHLFGISAAVIVSIQNARSQRSCPRSLVGSSGVSAPSTSSEEATALVSRRENSHHHILSHIIIISSVHTDSAYRLQIARSQRSIVGLGAVPSQPRLRRRPLTSLRTPAV